MPTYALPPATRVAGSGNPPQDMDDVINVLNHSLLQRVFYLDQYGADPTGASASDAAWTACYADAAAAVLTNSGAMIVLGGGTYKFTPGTVAITDGRIGFRGAGRGATTIKPSGAGTGSLLKFSAVSAGDGAGSAPVGGFTAFGWGDASAVNGVEYGDRPNGYLTDVTVTGFNGAAGSRGFWFHDSTNLSEGSFVVANADQNTVNYDFDAGGGNGSFDYSHFYLHLVVTTAGGSSAVGLRMVNNMHCVGGVIHLTGNASATTGLTTTVLQVGASTSDTCKIQGTVLNVMVEGDTSAGTIKDVLIQGASSNAGIVRCNGIMFFQNTSGTYAAGSVAGSAIFTTAGFMLLPLFSVGAHGTMTAIGTGGAFSTYSG
jgi:hypothetical protein